MNIVSMIKSFGRLRFKEKCSHDFVVIALAFLIAFGGFLTNEKLPRVGTFGDEWGYTQRAKYLYQQVFVVGTNSYHLQKILPSTIVHYTMRLFGMELIDQNVLKVFGVYAVLLTTVMAWIWCLIAKQLSISVRGKWLGFTAFFLNFPILKYASYNPISTDLFAYTIAMGMVYFFMTERFVGIYILTVLSAITWPTLVYVGIILAFFPKDHDMNKIHKPAPMNLHIVLVLLVVGYIACKMCFWFTGTNAPHSFASGIFTTGANQPIRPLLNLSMTVSLLYVLFSLIILTNHYKFFQIPYWIRKVSCGRLAIVLATIIPLKAYIYHISVRKQYVYSFSYLLKDTLGESILAPATFLVAHIAYYGPIIILLIFLWKPVCLLFQQYGIGLSMTAAICVLLSLNSESRRLINFYPFMIPFVIKATESLKWKESYYWFIAALSLLFSKVWLSFHSEPWGPSPLTFPNQNYFMNFGPWMSHHMYAVQGTIIILCAIVIYFLMFHNVNSSEEKGSAR